MFTLRVHMRRLAPPSQSVLAPIACHSVLSVSWCRPVAPQAVMADAFECIEMREARPWTFQIDSYAACACAHFMLHSDYMQLVQTPAGWQPRAALKRYWDNAQWSTVFDTLLNVPA